VIFGEKILFFLNIFFFGNQFATNNLSLSKSFHNSNFKCNFRCFVRTNFICIFSHKNAYVFQLTNFNLNNKFTWYVGYVDLIRFEMYAKYIIAIFIDKDLRVGEVILNCNYCIKGREGLRLWKSTTRRTSIYEIILLRLIIMEWLLLRKN